MNSESHHTLLPSEAGRQPGLRGIPLLRIVDSLHPFPAKHLMRDAAHHACQTHSHGPEQRRYYGDSIGQRPCTSPLTRS